MGSTLQKIICSSLILALPFLSTAHAKNLKLCSQGKLLVAKKQVGTAKYWAQNCQTNWQGQNMALTFNYSENIPEWAFKRAARHFLTKNVQDQQLFAKFEQLTALYRGVKPGDEYRLNYIYQQHTLQLELNQAQLGQIQHRSVQHYFSIWLGQQPFSIPLKQQLLKSS